MKLRDRKQTCSFLTRTFGTSVSNSEAKLLKNCVYEVEVSKLFTKVFLKDYEYSFLCTKQNLRFMTIRSSVYNDFSPTCSVIVVKKVNPGIMTYFGRTDKRERSETNLLLT